MNDGSTGSSENVHSKSPKKTKNSPVKWSLTILFGSFFLSVVFNAVSETALSNVNVVPAFFILAGFILLGIIFDIFGVATTTADEKPFNAMSSKRVKGAKEALWLVKNAEKVSSICNDVIGDICGIMSGSTAAIIIASLPLSGTNALLMSLVITGFVAGVTVGGKAFGKGFAITKSNDIVFFLAKTIRFFKVKK